MCLSVDISVVSVALPPPHPFGNRAAGHDDDPKHTSKMTTALLRKLKVKVIVTLQT